MVAESTSALIVILLGIGGVVFFCKYLSIRKRNKAGLSKAIDFKINTDLGICKVSGCKEEFHVYFDDGQVGFLVKNRIIVGYKAKNSSNYKEYPVERGE